MTDGVEKERVDERRRAGHGRSNPAEARALLADWTALTARLLGELGVTPEELQELIAAQVRVLELVERSAEQAARGAEGEGATVFRRVL